MATRLFLFVQMELPWELGPPDGRYLLRAAAERTTHPPHDGRDTDTRAEPERVVILETVGAAPRRGRLGARRRPPVDPEPEPTRVPVTRATVIDPVPVSAERQARAWLAGLDAEREAHGAAETLNRVLYAHRIAAADPYARELSPAQALTIRAGWGEGEQVAYGQWAHARELRQGGRRSRRRRAAALRSQERLTRLLGARERELLCEELALRARLDLDAGRWALAALELERAYAAALVELAAAERADLEARIAELRQLHAGVSVVAQVAISASKQEDDPEVLGHALARLEAALRARAAVSSVP